jgi:hypothetical protein
MQMEQAKGLRNRWKEQGSQPCDHPELDREYYLDSNTGDKVRQGGLFTSQVEV